MSIQFLAPGAPVLEGRLAVVRARRHGASSVVSYARWDWDDGVCEEAAGDFATGHLARRVHRYQAPGVYRVRLAMDGVAPGGRGSESAVRFVTVRARGQVGANGWVRDEVTGVRIPFGFLVHADRTGETGVTLRCLLDAGEMEGTALHWFMADPSESLHFGGDGRLGPHDAPIRYRVDVRGPGAGTGIGQHLTLTLYSPSDVPGRDSPMLRIAGRIRPGRADAIGDHRG